VGVAKEPLVSEPPVVAAFRVRQPVEEKFVSVVAGEGLDVEVDECGVNAAIKPFLVMLGNNHEVPPGVWGNLYWLLGEFFVTLKLIFFLFWWPFVLAEIAW
jgi:hypothetical protein